MKTKAQIVQELLEKKLITAEDAVVLLMGDKEYIYIPTFPPQPVYPAWPIQPWVVTCANGGNPQPIPGPYSGVITPDTEM